MIIDACRDGFEQHAQNYDDWFDGHESVYQAELAALRKFVPVTGMSIEVGVGTGLFAVPLGIQFGLDPSRCMLQKARRRGLSVCQAVGERLPFRDAQFDLVLLVTVICFVDDVPTLLQELHRVLKREGRLVIGFINRDSELGRSYESRKEVSMFYRDARFYSVAEVADWVKEAGFGSLRFCETLFDGPTEFSARGLEVREGYCDGTFVVLCARNT
ncbi:MAG: class I SAM-dependent methyltransferase [Nitrospirae bacterium]|nr:class I SAM-dependent methyltransferase [Nitrospirota bacterium]